VELGFSWAARLANSRSTASSPMSRRKLVISSALNGALSSPAMAMPSYFKNRRM
jgi:hypothetical protein